MPSQSPSKNRDLERDVSESPSKQRAPQENVEVEDDDDDVVQIVIENSLETSASAAISAAEQLENARMLFRSASAALPASSSSAAAAVDLTKEERVDLTEGPTPEFCQPAGESTSDADECSICLERGILGPGSPILACGTCKKVLHLQCAMKLKDPRCPNCRAQLFDEAPAAPRGGGRYGAPRYHDMMMDEMDFLDHMGELPPGRDIGEHRRRVRERARMFRERMAEGRMGRRHRIGPDGRRLRMRRTGGAPHPDDSSDSEDGDMPPRVPPAAGNNNNNNADAASAASGINRPRNPDNDAMLNDLPPVTGHNRNPRCSAFPTVRVHFFPGSQMDAAAVDPSSEQSTTATANTNQNNSTDDGNDASGSGDTGNGASGSGRAQGSTTRTRGGGGDDDFDSSDEDSDIEEIPEDEPEGRDEQEEEEQEAPPVVGHGVFKISIPDPPRNYDRRDGVGVDIVILLDVSSSMNDDQKLEHTKNVFEFLLGEVGQCDRVSLVTFSETGKIIIPLTPMDDAGKDRAKNAVRGLAVETNTKLGAGLEKVVDVLNNRRHKRKSCVLVLTDGEAEDDTSAFITDFTNKLSFDSGRLCKLFSFGFGTEHNAPLLANLASSNGGMYQFMEKPEDIKTSLSLVLTTAVLDIALEEVRAEVKVTNTALDVTFVDSGDLHELVWGAKRDLLFRVTKASDAAPLKVGDDVIISSPESNSSFHFWHGKSGRVVRNNGNTFFGNGRVNNFEVQIASMPGSPTVTIPEECLTKSYNFTEFIRGALHYKERYAYRGNTVTNSRMVHFHSPSM